MLRTMPATSLARVSLRNLHSHSTSRGIAHLTTKNALSKSELPLQCTQNVRLRAIVAFRPFATSIQRYQEHPSGAPHPDLDRRLSREKFEDKLEGRPMESPPPNEVNATSSTHAVFSEVGVHQEQKDEDMMAEIKSDLVGQELELCWCKADECLENDQRDLRAQRGAKRGFLAWVGGRTAIPSHLSYHCLPGLGYQSRGLDWTRISTIWQHSSDGATIYRTASNWIRCCRKYPTFSNSNFTHSLSRARYLIGLELTNIL